MDWLASLAARTGGGGAGAGPGAGRAEWAGPTLLRPGSFKAQGAEPGQTPIEYIQSWIRRRMYEFGGRGARLADRVLVVRAETGSGKSFLMPVWIFRLLRSERSAQRHRGPAVLCTQPRVLTAKALAEGVAAHPKNPDMVLGETCGYLTGPVQNAPVTGLIYATAGVLAVQLQHLEDAELMDRYRVIIVDEAHERSLDSDMTLSLLRGFYARNAGNERLPFLILTSATFDPQRYTDYFGVGPANVVEVSGRQHEIRTHWPAHGVNDYVAAAAETVLRIHAENAQDAPGRGDVLVFLPGQAEMRGVAEKLEEALSEPALAGAPFLLLVLNRDIVASQAGDYQLVFAPPDRLPLVLGARPTRRVILSTVVAETGVTIDTLRYVVDCGWNRTHEVYYPAGVAGVVTRPAPQSRVEQRRGRVGRLFPGDFHPLYTKNVYEALDEAQLPEIITQGPGALLLALVRSQQRQKLRMGALPEFRLEDLGLLDPPTAEAYLAENSAAVAMGFVSPRAPLPSRWPPAMLESASQTEPTSGPLAPARGYGLTALGHLAALFTRTPMEGVRVLLAGYSWRVAASDLITAVAMAGFTVSDLLVRRRGEGPLPPDADALFAALPEFITSRWTGAEGGSDESSADFDGEDADGPASGGLGRTFGGSAGAGAHARPLSGWAARSGRPLRAAAAPGGHPAGAGDAKLPPAASEHYYYRARLLMADTFAEAVLIFDAFAAQAEKAPDRPLPHLVDWCLGRGLSPEAMLALASRRSLIIEELALAGLNPYRLPDQRLSRLGARDFTDGLTRFKRCIYAGHRARLLRFDPEKENYYTERGVRVRAPGLLAPSLLSRLRAMGAATEELAPPLWVVTDQLRFAPAPKRAQDTGPPLLYTIEAGQISVLDGYFAPDLSLDEPREASDEAGAAASSAPELSAGSLPGRNDASAGAPSAAEAAAQLAAYNRALRAVQTVEWGAVAAPAQKLGNLTRAALFAPRQQELLISVPLGSEKVPCPGLPVSGPPGGSAAKEPALTVAPAHS